MTASLNDGASDMKERLALPRDNGEIIFNAPWEARAFGMAVALNESGAYEWRDFQQRLAAEIAAAEHTDAADSYYQHWLASLEALLIESGVITPEEIEALTVKYASDEHEGGID